MQTGANDIPGGEGTLLHSQSDGICERKLKLKLSEEKHRTKTLEQHAQRAAKPKTTADIFFSFIYTYPASGHHMCFKRIIKFSTHCSHKGLQC